ncbi:ATP-dependent RNA helicase SUPV3L1/SUV3 [Sphingomonas jejuensis]|uniref:ATP-dependent RNA helicase SUPV3L1/SUV3 n=1 Tax=Sphingomonas jejuensis TaxID=904715 RepID=A0ABX0XLW9_9SPHN|nr:helicase-related protein [Sphingomonas jejuensis]NJC34234.1 ATP-dependent RNA helicase SUPV3L1/SUV3 [Sphingomonas jejuensis]
MGMFARSPVAAVLGPTNTGKTHLAVERMCGHSSGMIGFPLRLLAREVYDRVVALKGADSVALVTGEERIEPPKARYFLCTAEAMPLSRDVAFVAVDEAQLGADRERGHVFTDRLLHARGREETLILGSEALKPVVRHLLPDAEIVTRPRFSTLSYAGAKKLSRLPKRSAIVAFSAEEVYAVAEMLRRQRGGAAVVMGALSPRTRNAQVAMFQAGEVDYLVATDAVGMGLNLDVAHVAFASLTKFDGRRTRRLTVGEMAQIAGRAGRHQRDGTFGSVGAEDGPGAFLPEEIEAIEEHRFPTLDYLNWRSSDLDMSSVGALIASLAAPSDDVVLRAGPEATDVQVLKRLAGEDWVAARARGPRAVARLWAAAGVPDFQKSGPEHHSRFVARLYRHLSEGDGRVPHAWFADGLQRLDNVGGDVDTIAGRIAAVRSFAYVAQRPDWLHDPAHWAERTRAVEERLSDALHAGLTQRFVDRRTTVLMRQIGADSALLPVEVAADGAVAVDGEPIGRLDGFHFTAVADARGGDARRLLAAAERRLVGERARRAAALVAAPDAAFALLTEPGQPVAICWDGRRVAVLERGRSLIEPKLRADRGLAALDELSRARVMERLRHWLAAEITQRLRPLQALAAALPAAPVAARAMLAALAEAGGIVDRRHMATVLPQLDGDARRETRRLGITIGALDLFMPALLKPEAVRWRTALMAARAGTVMPVLPPAASVVAEGDGDATAPTLIAAGFRLLGDQALRVDMAERIARAAHDARDGRKAFVPDPALTTSIGLRADAIGRLMRAIGFRAGGEAGSWAWQGRRPAKPDQRAATGPFARLADLARHGG